MFTEECTAVSVETHDSIQEIEVRGKNNIKPEKTSSKDSYLRSFGCTTIDACASDTGL